MALPGSTYFCKISILIKNITSILSWQIKHHYILYIQILSAADVLFVYFCESPNNVHNSSTVLGPKVKSKNKRCQVWTPTVNGLDWILDDCIRKLLSEVKQGVITKAICLKKNWDNPCQNLLVLMNQVKEPKMGRFWLQITCHGICMVFGNFDHYYHNYHLNQWSLILQYTLNKAFEVKMAFLLGRRIVWLARVMLSDQTAWSHMQCILCIEYWKHI